MAEIVLSPTPLEAELHGEAYEAFMQALRDAGHEVRLEAPAEQSSVDVETYVAALVVRVVERVVVEELGEIIREHLRARRRGRRRREAVIQDVYDQELDRVPLDRD